MVSYLMHKLTENLCNQATYTGKFVTVNDNTVIYIFKVLLLLIKLLLLQDVPFKRKKKKKKGDLKGPCIVSDTLVSELQFEMLNLKPTVI